GARSAGGRRGGAAAAGGFGGWGFGSRRGGSPPGMRGPASGPGMPGAMPGGGDAGGTFWDRYTAAIQQEDKANANADREQCEHVTLARIAALVQVLGPESPALRRGLVRYLAGVSHAEATRQLARMAIFSPEESIRQDAAAALKVRRERDYTAVLVQGLRYPLPAVAQRAADAVAKLERNDLIPQLVDLLDEPDPRLPAAKQVGE